jgi:hypothetical protein
MDFLRVFVSRFSYALSMYSYVYICNEKVRENRINILFIVFY